MTRRRSARFSVSLARLTAYGSNQANASAVQNKSQAACLYPTPIDKGSDPFSLTLTLPLPPSINHQYATVQGRRVLSSAGRRFKSHVGQEVLYLLARQRSPSASVQTLQGLRLALDLRFYFVSILSRDIDGGLKITQDALCEALGINDNRIVEVSLRKNVDTAAPRMEVSLRETHSS
jgi:crossover junction endodeoxyribonuclease RusA